MKSRDKTPEDYVRYVRNDLMGIAREDLVYDIARHVDSTVHLFEKWGLPIWKDEKGNYVFEGGWQVMINGESYKNIVAEAARNALATIGNDNIYERVFIVEPLIEGDRVAGAVGFSTRKISSTYSGPKQSWWPWAELCTYSGRARWAKG